MIVAIFINQSSSHASLQVQRTHCANCVVWAKSDSLVRDIIKLSPSTAVKFLSFQKFVYIQFILLVCFAAFSDTLIICFGEFAKAEDDLLCLT